MRAIWEIYKISTVIFLNLSTQIAHFFIREDASEQSVFLAEGGGRGMGALCLRKGSTPWYQL